jgi:hypothetical protein
MIQETTKEAVKANKIKELKQFSATQDNIILTAKLMAHMALQDVLYDAYIKICAKVVEDGNYKFDQKFYEGKYGEMRDEKEHPSDRKFIYRPNKKYFTDNAYHMAGVGTYRTEAYNTSDASKYSEEVHKRTQDSGMIEGQNTICMINYKIIQLERELMHAMQPITQIDPSSIYGDKREKLIDLSLKIMGNSVANMNKAERTKIEKEVYNNYLSK